MRVGSLLLCLFLCLAHLVVQESHALHHAAQRKHYNQTCIANVRLMTISSGGKGRLGLPVGVCHS